jgi:hypothetical protein
VQKNLGCQRTQLYVCEPGEKQKIVSVMKSERRGGPGHQHAQSLSNVCKTWSARRKLREAERGGTLPKESSVGNAGIGDYPPLQSCSSPRTEDVSFLGRYANWQCSVRPATKGQRLRHIRRIIVAPARRAHAHHPGAQPTCWHGEQRRLMPGIIEISRSGAECSHCQCNPADRMVGP